MHVDPYWDAWPGPNSNPLLNTDYHMQQAHVLHEVVSHNWSEFSSTVCAMWWNRRGGLSYTSRTVQTVQEIVTCAKQPLAAYGTRSSSLSPVWSGKPLECQKLSFPQYSAGVDCHTTILLPNAIMAKCWFQRYRTRAALIYLYKDEVELFFAWRLTQPHDHAVEHTQYSRHNMYTPHLWMHTHSITRSPPPQTALVSKVVPDVTNAGTKNCSRKMLAAGTAQF